MKRAIRAITGYRDDVDLQARWWHRLISVGYAMTFGLLALAVAWIAITETRPEVRADNVIVSATLRSLFTEPHSPATNLARLLADMPGEAGIRRTDGSIEHLNDYYLENSFCSTRALEAPEALAEHLNSANFTREHTAATVLARQLNETKPGEDGLCWFHDDLTRMIGEGPGDIVSYEFTAAAKGMVWLRSLAVVAIGLAAVHLLLASLYHRGFVYVVCGPRKGARQS